jgi:hypothetical protein
MIRKGTLECPMCGHGMKAWFQTGVPTVLCPVCQAQPTLTGRLIQAMALIWSWLAGYNRKELAL